MAKLYGEHAVAALLKSDMPVHGLYIEAGREKVYSSYIQAAKAKKISVNISQKMAKIFPQGRHQGIGAEFDFRFTSLGDIQFNDQSRFLMLDRVQDPHNFGACLRSAAAFGVDAVIIPSRAHAPINEVVHQSSCGGSLIVPIVSVNNLNQAMSEMKDQGVWFIATSEHGSTQMTDMPKDRSLCIVMGSEGEGVRQKLFDGCDYQVKIHTSGQLSTLNVSVATGILLQNAQVQ